MKRATKGTELCARLAVEMTFQALSIDELSDRCGAWRNTVALCMRTMHFCGVAHVAAWRKPQRGKMIALWKLGAAPDAPCEALRWGPTSPSRVSAPAAAFVVLVRTLQTPTTKEDLAEATGLHVNTIRRVLDVMQYGGVVHIASWDRAGRISRPEWRMGSKRNAPRPAQLNHATVSRNYRQRLKRLDGVAPLLSVSAQWAGASAFNLAQSAA